MTQSLGIGQCTSPEPTNPKERMTLCFTVFDAIYKVMDNLRFTRIAVQDILLHYALERTFYLELRTSLRGGMGKVWMKDGLGDIINSALTDVSMTHGNKEDYLREVQLTIVQLQQGRLVSLEPPFDFMEDINTDISHTDDDCDIPLWFLDSFAPIARRIYCRSDTLVTSTDLGCIFKSFHTSLEAEDHASTLSQGDRSNMNEANIIAWRSFNALRWHIHHHMRVRLLVSVNRASTTEDMMETLQATERVLETDQRVMITEGSKESEGCILEGYNHSPASTVSLFPYIVGLDLGGNAYKGDLGDILRLLRSHRAVPHSLHTLHGDAKYSIGMSLPTVPQGGPSVSGHLLPLVSYLPHTIHAGEKDDVEEMELIYHYNPERYGHLVFVPEEVSQTKKGKLQRKEYENDEMSTTRTIREVDVTTPSLLYLIQRQPNRLPFLTLQASEGLEGLCKECHSTSHINKPPNTTDIYTDTVTTHHAMSRVGGVVEMCLTSNIVTSGLSTVDDHHIDKWLNTVGQLVPSSSICLPSLGGGLVPSGSYENSGVRDYNDNNDKYNNTNTYNSTEYAPVVTINTDDRGVFCTSMTKELLLLSSHTSLFPHVPCTNTTTTTATTTAAAAAAIDYDRVRAEACFVLQRRALSVAFPTIEIHTYNVPHTVPSSLPKVITTEDSSSVGCSPLTLHGTTPYYQHHLMAEYDHYCYALGLAEV